MISWQQVIEEYKTGRVDVALLDIRMPIINGVDAVKQITVHTSVKYIILTTFEEDKPASDAVKNGAKVYLLIFTIKRKPPDYLNDRWFFTDLINILLKIVP